MTTADGLSFGPFHLVVSERLLTREGAPLVLGSRALEILIVLISRPNEVISKKDLMSRVWPDVIVEEGSLRFHVASLRRALGDGKDGARYITTIPGRGYCFVAPVSQPGSPRDDTPVVAGNFPHANLPSRLSRVVGRDEDVLRLAAQLNASRFVTIVGAGGVGKTTVAIAVGHHLIDAFSGALLFVDLGMLGDPDLVTAGIASMLGLSVQSNDATPNLIAYLRNKRILLILDTCEHLVEAVALLAANIIDAAPQVHILATSREALRVEGEHIYRLDGLACPPDDPALTAAVVRTFPATQLFVERAVASGARLDVSDAEAPIVASICRKLDGVALAIELAARRVESYGLRQTAALLDQRLTLLWLGTRTAPPRQKTLQATLDWSFGLLTELERVVLRRLAAFVGHFTLDAALEVVTSATLDRSSVITAIDSLVAKSIAATSPFGAMMRYRLLDATRAYVLESNIDDAESADLAVRHAAYYRKWLEQAGTEWSGLTTGAERAPHFAAVNNVRAALEWCFGAKGNTDIGIGLAAAAAPVFLVMSLLTECHRWSERALLALDDTTRGGPEEMHLQAGLGISSMYTMGNNEQSYAALMRGLELAEKFHDPVNQFRLISQLHSFHRRAGNFDRMLAVAQRSEAIAKEMADPIGIYAVHSLLGVSHHLIGNQAEAHAHLEMALAQASASNSAKARHFGFHYERPRIVMARTLWLLGYPDQAVRFARETVDGLTATETVTICIALIWGACVFRWTGDLASADECIDRVIPHAERHALTPYQAVAYGLKGEVLIQRGEIETGMELLRSSLATLSAERYELYATEFNGSLAQGFAMMGRLDQALPIIDKTIAQVKRHGELSEPELQRIRGELLEKTADDPGAEQAFRRSIELADQQSALSWRLRASTSLARLQFRQGRREEARKVLGETYARFGEGFGTADLKTAERLLATLR
ncbi:MAG: winged helix-turn-helix domain-containing protein [Bradyrhizobium sp.]|nr:winged helix-turn-helix domain-containing protein [Bradyrhizobium sp.]